MKILFLIFLSFLILFFDTAPQAMDIEIETPRMTLRPWKTQKDTEVWFDIEQQDTAPIYATLFPFVVTNIRELAIPRTKNRIEKVQNSFSHVLEDGLAKGAIMPLVPLPFTFAVCLKGSEKLMGFINLSKLNKKGFSEFGWMIAPEYRSKGFGTELLQHVIQHFSQFIGMDIPDYAGKSQKWKTFKGLKASVDMLNPGSLKAVGKFMTPYKIEHDTERARVLFFNSVEIHFQFPPKEEYLSESDIENIKNLSSQNQTIREQAIIHIKKRFDAEGKWFPIISRFFFHTFIQNLLRAWSATNKGLPAPE